MYLIVCKTLCEFNLKKWTPAKVYCITPKNPVLTLPNIQIVDEDTTLHRVVEQSRDSPLNVSQVDTSTEY